MLRGLRRLKKVLVVKYVIDYLATIPPKVRLVFRLVCFLTSIWARVFRVLRRTSEIEEEDVLDFDFSFSVVRRNRWLNRLDKATRNAEQLMGDYR